MNRAAAIRAAGVNLPRLVLLALLAFGVAGMHTFGHGHQHAAVDLAEHSGTHDAPIGRADDLVARDPALRGRVDRAVAGDVAVTDRVGNAVTAADRTERVALVQPGGTGALPTGFTVCLAVLGVVGLVLWAAVTSGRIPGGGRGGLSVWMRPLVSGRDPPIGRHGLHLAVVSVLRI